jgi:glycosyltransferase involved in cell wall biosynthesis
MSGAGSRRQLVTIGVISLNRLFYLRALIESLRECVEYPNLQWVVVDGCSQEPGLREYLESLGFLDELVFVESGQLADAMNRMVELTRGECLMMLPDRVQFVARGDWMKDLVEIAGHARVGHVCFDVQRRATLQHQFGERYLQARSRRVVLPFGHRRARHYTSSTGREFLGYGRTLPGINTGGIAFNRVAIWRRLGRWRSTMTSQLTNDAGLGAETEMLARYRRSGLRLERVLMRRPVAAAIVTDPRGTAAKIRLGNRRYGHYFPPPDGRFYYNVSDDAELAVRFGDAYPAPSFEQFVQPLGFDLPLDENGDLRKVSVISDEEPYELVIPPDA